MIYIIDDDQYVRRGFELLFKASDLECTLFGSAGEFVEILPDIKDDILILDMHMPGMNGCELLAYLADNEIFLPVIIVTAYDEPASRECAKKYGALAYLRKPVDSQALIDLVKYSLKPV